MIYRFLHITVTPAFGAVQTATMQQRLSDLGRDWMSYNQFCWVLWTNKNILTVSEMIMGDIDPQDHLLVVALNPGEVPNGRLPNWVWDWFNRPRNIISGEVLTPALPAPGALNVFENENLDAWYAPTTPGKAQF